MQLIKDATSQKLRGAYYTPATIANFILRWGINGEERLDILEPSCGDGVFLECLANNNVPYDSITAVEYEAEEVEKARAIRLANANIIN